MKSARLEIVFVCLLLMAETNGWSISQPQTILDQCKDQYLIKGKYGFEWFWSVHRSIRSTLQFTSEFGLVRMFILSEEPCDLKSLAQSIIISLNIAMNSL